MNTLNDLPTERWLSILDELGKMAVQRVTLTGGEVFTRPDVFQLIDGIVANRMRYRILTNGTLITEKTLAEFEVGKRRLRLDTIQISVDGSRAEIHNLSRPPNSFERAIRALRLLVAEGFPVTARVTINQHNVDDLEDIASLLLQDVGLLNFSTNETSPMGSAKCTGENLILTRDQRRRAMETLARLNIQYGDCIGALSGPLVMAKRQADIKARMERGETESPKEGKLTSCGTVFSKMSILHDGTIVPCCLLPKLTMGVAGKNSLQDVWLHHPSINIVRQRGEIPVRMLPTCKNCQYAGFCSGGCPAMVMSQTGRLNARDPMDCYRIYVGEEVSDDAL
jgi:SynChlorMet cassette radical SAM/SPASM protein ScmE